jgi:hypothetical protein
MLNHENMFEYYHLLHLSNGTILDLAAGPTAFLTEPSPTIFGSSGIQSAEEWKAEQEKNDPEGRDIIIIVPGPDVNTPETRILALESPKNMTAPDDTKADFFMGPDSYVERGPRCVSKWSTTYLYSLATSLTELGLW